MSNCCQNIKQVFFSNWEEAHLNSYLNRIQNTVTLKESSTNSTYSNLSKMNPNAK